MFDAQVYVERRIALRERVGSGCILIPGNDLVGMNYRDNAYAFRQDGSFLYFAGLDEPGLCLWLDCDSGEEMLCGPVLGLTHAIWSGSAPSLHELAARCGIVRAGTMDDLGRSCQTARGLERAVHYPPAYRGDGILLLARLLGLSPAEILANPSLELIEAVVAQRSVKSEAEVAEIRRAVALSAESYALLMSLCRPGATESALYGRLQGHILACGSREAFPTILTRRGDVLHNHGHDQTLEDGDLLLVDSGVHSALGYASDITRTLPVGKGFTARQRDIYSIVLTAQSAGIASIAPGVPFVDCHRAAALAVAAGLKEMGLLRGDPAEVVAAGAHALFFPHGLGHMLGLDVHDMESLGEDNVGYDAQFRRSQQFGLSGLRLARRLQAGFVLTVEPGIYFIAPLIDAWREQGRHADFINYDAVETFRGFGGIRIEDDVLVTEAGHEVLSAGIPRSIEEICACMEERL
jgi:Xaa-Pro aminopeptidase